MINAVGYCRLSRDDDRENYTSIEEQKHMIQNYTSNKGWILKDFYIDDNVSGYSFDRPAFNEMLDKVKYGNIDVIVVKDLSRIGRHNGKTLVFLDELKSINKNLIVLENAGGEYNLLEDRDDTIGITTWFNERYVKDTSRKIRSSMHSRQKDGRLLMSSYYYGYIKDLEDRTKLNVDEEVRSVIEKIFDMYINERMGAVKIANKLNELNIDTPSMHFYKQKLAKGKEYKRLLQTTWARYMVLHIIGNDMYTGLFRTHKKETVGIRGKIKVIPKDLNFIFENHHEAIISKDIYDTAQIMRKKRINVEYNHKQRKYIFRGYLKCGECGGCASGKTINRKIGKIMGYSCLKYAEKGNKGCRACEVTEDYVLRNLKSFLGELSKTYKSVLENIKVSKIEENKKITEKEFKLKKSNIESKLQLIISQKISDMVKAQSDVEKEAVEKSYDKLAKDLHYELNAIDKKIKEVKEINISKIKEKIETSIDIFDKIIVSEQPSQILLNQILNKIKVYRDKTLEFDLKINVEEMII